MEIAQRSGYSSADLMVRFKAGLNKASKDWLLISLLRDTKPTTIQELVKLANDTDFTVWGLTEEFGTSKSSGSSRDPMAMEIDAARITPTGRTREEFTTAMRGRCYGCGSTDHVKRNGNHGSTRCAYCHRLGHLERVCQDRYLGLEKGRGDRPGNKARVAASSTEFSLFPGETITSTSTAPPPAPAPAAPSGMEALMAEMAKQNAILAALTKKDF